MSILSVENVSHDFGGRTILENASFRLLNGEHIGLVGANGEGKSTFFKILLLVRLLRIQERLNGVKEFQQVI